jgi:Flp pilus assembly CpaE family ATPase
MRTSSNKGERWLVSIIDIPEPEKLRKFSFISFKTGSGSAAGPGLKL